MCVGKEDTSQKPKDSEDKKSGAWHNYNEVGHCAEMLEKEPKAIMMLAQVGPVVERLNNVEFLVGSGAVYHVRSCRTTAGSSLEKTLLTVTGTSVASQGTLEMKTRRSHV